MTPEQPKEKKVELRQKEVKTDEIPTIYEEPIPTLFIDGFKGAFAVNNTLRINLYEQRLDPTTEVFSQRIVTRLVMPMEVFHAMTKAFNDMQSAKSAPAAAKDKEDGK